MLEKLFKDTEIPGLKMIAGIDEESIRETYNGEGIKFTFKNSLRADNVLIQPFKDRYIMAFKKGDSLVAETVVPKEQIGKTFEEVTGLFISVFG